MSADIARFFPNIGNGLLSFGFAAAVFQFEVTITRKLVCEPLVLL
jgi:hypothetical protein